MRLCPLANHSRKRKSVHCYSNGVHEPVDIRRTWNRRLYVNCHPLIHDMGIGEGRNCLARLWWNALMTVTRSIRLNNAGFQRKPIETGVKRTNRYLWVREPALRYSTGPLPVNKRPGPSGQEEHYSRRKTGERRGSRCLTTKPAKSLVTPHNAEI